MKNLKRTTAAALALGLMFSPVSANAATDDLKSMPLTDVLNLPSAEFDRNSADFDIFTYIFMDVWGQLPESPVQAIANGNTALATWRLATLHVKLRVLQYSRTEAIGVYPKEELRGIQSLPTLHLSSEPLI